MQSSKHILSNDQGLHRRSHPRNLTAYVPPQYKRQQRLKYWPSISCSHLKINTQTSFAININSKYEFDVFNSGRSSLTLVSSGLTETARDRTRTSLGLRSGIATAGWISRTSGPPNRVNTTARQLVAMDLWAINLWRSPCGTDPDDHHIVLETDHHRPLRKCGVEHTNGNRLRWWLMNRKWENSQIYPKY